MIRIFRADGSLEEYPAAFHAVAASGKLVLSDQDGSILEILATDNILIYGQSEAIVTLVDAYRANKTALPHTTGMQRLDC